MSRTGARVAIIGTTAWGTTLGVMLGQRDIRVKLWARSEEEARALNRARENPTRLPGISWPQVLEASGSMEEALAGADLLIFAVPSQTMRANAGQARDYLDEKTLVLSASKGLEVEGAKRMSQVLAEELAPRPRGGICILSGPNLSGEISHGLPAAAVIAAADIASAHKAQQILMSPLFRVYTNTDVVGVELGGTLKNVIALGAGMADGLGLGDNAKASLIVRGLAETSRLGVAMGANPLTFAGLAGLGDMVVTCASGLSRNHFVGQELARGRKLDEITGSMMGIAEGITTAIAARRLAGEQGIEMPITEQVYQVLFEGLEVRRAVSELMERQPKGELEGLA